MLKGAIVGFGRMGLTHFSILNSHPDVQFVAVCDSSDFVLKNVARYMKLEAFREPDRMFDATDIDFVIVATPTVHHADVVRLAVRKDIHVFVEKPLALTPEQGQELLLLVQGKRIVHQVGYVIRFNDVFRKVKTLLDRKAIGELLTFKIEINGPTVLHGVRNSWRSRKREGGGCVYDFASHGVDLANYLIGPPDEVVGTVFQRIYSSEVEDSVSSTFLYRNQVRGNLLVNWSDPSYRKPAYRFEALGRRGRIIADLHAFKIFVREAMRSDGLSPGWNQRYVTDFGEPVRFYVRGFEFTRQLDYFVDCILNNVSCQVCSFRDGLETDTIIGRLFTDAARGSRRYG